MASDWLVAQLPTNPKPCLKMATSSYLNHRVSVFPVARHFITTSRNAAAGLTLFSTGKDMSTHGTGEEKYGRVSIGSDFNSFRPAWFAIYESTFLMTSCHKAFKLKKNKFGWDAGNSIDINSTLCHVVTWHQQGNNALYFPRVLVSLTPQATSKRNACVVKKQQIP